MKKRIFKLLSVIGIYLIVFCAAASSASEAAGNQETAPATSVRLISSKPLAVSVEPQSPSRPEWLLASFADSSEAAAVAPDIDADSFGGQISEVEDPSYEYNDEEKAYIARVVYAEARGESFEGKVAVAAVVLNRFESGEFGSTVKRVVFARKQFAVSKRYNDECLDAVNAAIEQDDAFPEDMYYFRVSKSKKWRSFEYYDRIGNHSFYCA